MSGLMTPRQVAAKYPVSLEDLKRDLKAGIAPHIPVGKGSNRRHRRMTDEHVREYLARKEAEARAAAESAPEPEPVDPVAQAIAATRLRQRRRTGHRNTY